MLLTKQGRYSGFLRPISYLIDLGLILFLAYYLPIQLYNLILFFGYIIFCWVIISVRNNFYEVERYTKLPLIFSLYFLSFKVGKVIKLS